MKKLMLVCLMSLTIFLSGCQSFQKERDLEMYIVGAGLSYAVAKHICRTSEHDEKCGIGAAATFVLWY